MLDEQGEEISDALLQATQARMMEADMHDGEEFEGVEPEEEEEAVIEPVEEEAVVEEVEPTPDPLEEEVKAEEADPDATPTPEAKVEDSEAKGMPDAYYRAAVHQGWTSEEVQELYASDPVLAEKTCKKLYETTNRLTNEFANVGRAKQQTEQQAAADAVVKTPDVSAVDLSALKEQYGSDDPLVKTVEAILANQVNTQPAPAPVETQPQAPAPAEDTTARQILDNFYAAPEMKSYDDFYGQGNDANKLTHEQYQRRFSVATLCDEIMIGADAMGRQMAVEDALEAAHLRISEPVRETVIRQNIAKTLIKRAKSITLAPGGQVETVDPSKEVSSDELETRTAARLGKLKWNS